MIITVDLWDLYSTMNPSFSLKHKRSIVSVFLECHSEYYSLVNEVKEHPGCVPETIKRLLTVKELKSVDINLMETCLEELEVRLNEFIDHAGIVIPFVGYIDIECIKDVAILRFVEKNVVDRLDNLMSKVKYSRLIGESKVSHTQGVYEDLLETTASFKCMDKFKDWLQEIDSKSATPIPETFLRYVDDFINSVGWED